LRVLQRPSHEEEQEVETVKIGYIVTGKMMRQNSGLQNGIIGVEKWRVCKLPYEINWTYIAFSSTCLNAS